MLMYFLFFAFGVLILCTWYHLNTEDNIGLEQEVTMQDVYNEFDAIRTRHGITKWASKKVVRKYAFDVPGVPSESDYLKVHYSFEGRLLCGFCLWVSEAVPLETA